MKLAIIGSRDFTDYQLCCKAIDQFLDEWDLSPAEITEVVSGGARGADSLAEKWATEKNLSMKIFYPDWKTYGKAAGPRRNQMIIEYTNYLIAFPSITGRGTQDSLRKANYMKKPTKVLWFDRDIKSTEPNKSNGFNFKCL